MAPAAYLSCPLAGFRIAHNRERNKESGCGFSLVGGENIPTLKLLNIKNSSETH